MTLRYSSKYLDNCLLAARSTDGDPTSNPVSALLKKAYARLSLLCMSSENHRNDGMRGESFEGSSNIIDILDQTQQFSSDENVLAMLKHTTGHDKIHVEMVLRYSDHKLSEGSDGKQQLSNPLEADCSLALLGSPMGVKTTHHELHPVKESSAMWARMLQVAGAEYTVCLVTCASRIYADGTAGASHEDRSRLFVEIFL